MLSATKQKEQKTKNVHVQLQRERRKHVKLTNFPSAEWSAVCFRFDQTAAELMHLFSCYSLSRALYVLPATEFYIFFLSLSAANVVDFSSGSCDETQKTEEAIWIRWKANESRGDADEQDFLKFKTNFVSSVWLRQS